MVDIWGEQLPARQSPTSLVHLGGFLFSRCSDGLSLNNATSQKPFLLRLLHLLFLNFLRAQVYVYLSLFPTFVRTRLTPYIGSIA